MTRWLLSRDMAAAFALAALVAGPVGAESYRLAPGDTLRAQIIGLDNQTYTATVNSAGNIRLPYLGTHEAAGRTLDELTQEITLTTAGRQIQLAQQGVNTVVVLDENDLFLDIETYRPVTVVGVVASPGNVAFQPGMSVRTAMGSAGGAALLAQSDRADQLANWRTRQIELHQSEAWLLADLWRIDALLSDAEIGQPPEDFAVTLTGRLKESDLDIVRERIQTERSQLQRERDDKDARIELTRQQIDFLNTALEQFQTASDIEEKRLRDVLQLSDQGLATANTLDNAREGALNASSRLLTTQADLAEAERELQALSLSKRGLDEDFTAKLLEDKSQVGRKLAETRAPRSPIRLH